MRDGDWILPGGGGLFFEDGSPAEIRDVDISPEPGYEPPDFGLRNMTFTGYIEASYAQMRRIRKMLHALANRKRRAVRTAKRRREKERRRMMKEEDKKK